MPADESTAEVSRLLEQWDAINRSPLQLSAILAGDKVTDMASAEGDTHLVAVLARLFLTAVRSDVTDSKSDTFSEIRHVWIENFCFGQTLQL